MNKGFPEDFLQELKQRANLVTIVNRYVPLEKKGSNYWGRCPFHLEKTPSFSVNEPDQYYHCFGCKASGNVFKFIMEMESVSFYDAVKILAEEMHMKIPTTLQDSDEYEKKKKERERLVACMRLCAKHYHENLKSSDVARQYLAGRNISSDMISRFGIGYASDFSEVLVYLRKNGFSDKEILDCGIAKEKDGRMYDVLGKRIAFPVINIYGEVVAFSGRSMEKNVEYAKYLNTGDTSLFSKSKNLFGINLVKKAKQDGGLKEVIIVEGQIDVISLHQAGFSNALASLGTALTAEQAKMIKRLSDNVIICYDGDFAGVKATIRGLDILKQENLNVRVASMPNGMDPDELIKVKGKEAFRYVLDDALPLVEFKLKYLEKQYNLHDFDGKTKFVEEALNVLVDLSDVEAEVYLNYIKDKAQVNIEFLRDKLRRDHTLKLTSANLIKRAPLSREEKKDSLIEQSLYCVVANILRGKEYAHISAEFINTLDVPYNEFIMFLQDDTKGVNDFIQKFEDDYAEVIGEIINFSFSEDDDSNKTQYQDCLWLVYKTNLQKQKQILSEQLERASAEERKEIFQKIMRIEQQIKNRSIE